MTEILATIEQALRDALANQIVGGGLVLMFAGSALALCRSVPMRLWAATKRQCVVTVDVVNSDPLFGWLTLWLDAQPYSKRARLLTASTHSGRGGIGATSPQPIGMVGGSGQPEPPSILFTPAPGMHLLWHQKRPVLLSRDRKEVSQKDGWSAYQETLTIRVLGRNADAVRGMLEEARALATKEDRRVGVYIARYGDWYRVHESRPRPLASVVLPAGQMEEVIADARAFLASGAWYAERGIPWRRGYLFEGIPGSGKTSAIGALAGHLGLDLYLCNVAERGMSDQELTRSMLAVPERSVVLLEDVDGIVNGREMKAENGVTFSGLLNALDGVASRPGVLTFLTTNHAERLDPALLRSGRVDYRLTFGPATADQAERFFRHFYAAGADDVTARLAEHFGRYGAGRPIAELQEVLLRHRDDPSGAVAALLPLLHEVAA